MSLVTKNFWRNKHVFLTGHTGFKGSWMALWLSSLGAHVTGLGLEPQTPLYEQLRLNNYIESHFGDIRDQERLVSLLTETSPDIVIHMAAQSLVRRSFDEPIGTFETNLMGTVNLLCSSALLSKPPAVTLIVTSDKVYRNREDGIAFTEKDSLGGDDPYSASKACAELAVTALRHIVPPTANIVTARAGNVIGGGDFSEDRLIPDVIRAWEKGTPLIIRSPSSTRPWQHVLDSLAGYLCYIETLAAGRRVPLSLNFGPHATSAASVLHIVKMMETALGKSLQHEVQPTTDNKVEKKLLGVNASLAKQSLGWQPCLTLKEAITLTADWYRARLEHANMDTFTLQQITAFEKLL